MREREYSDHSASSRKSNRNSYNSLSGSSAKKNIGMISNELMREDSFSDEPKSGKKGSEKPAFKNEKELREAQKKLAEELEAARKLVNANEKEIWNIQDEIARDAAKINFRKPGLKGMLVYNLGSNPYGPDPAPAQHMGAGNGEPIVPNALNVPKWKPQRKELSSHSAISKTRNAIARGAGLYVLRPILSPATGAGKLFGITTGMKSRAENKLMGNEVQESINHRTIPGWGGKQFDPNKNTGKDILEDFRRIPTVWARTTAAQAVESHMVGTGYNRHQEFINVPPKVTIYVHQPKAGSSRSMHSDECGHVFLGLEYTRFSKITDRNERFRIICGFYPHRDFVGSTASALMGSGGAVVPGMLTDDTNHPYDISRTYTATDKQIEKIAEETGKYPEEGGYNFFTRNCATFVKTMFERGGLAAPSGDLEKYVLGSNKVINPGLENTFKKESFRFNAKTNVGLMVAHGAHNLFDTNMHNMMNRRADRNDETYQGEGNKLMTRKAFQEYKSTKHAGGFGQQGWIPASFGEKLRRIGDTSGVLGSYNYSESVKKSEKDDESEVFKNLAAAAKKEGIALQSAIRKIISEEQMGKIQGKFNEWFSSLPKSGEEAESLQRRYDEVVEFMGHNEDHTKRKLSEVLSPSDLRNAYTLVTRRINKTSFNYLYNLKNDSRINKEVMNLLSIYEHIRRVLDQKYDQWSLVKSETPTSDLFYLRERALRNSYHMEIGDMEADLTPSDYEAFLQIYKTPREAIKNAHEYKKLDKKLEDKKKGKGLKKWYNPLTWFNGKKEKRLDELNKKRSLAADYSAAHRYLLNKDNFSADDFDYISKLRGMEEKDRSLIRSGRTGNGLYDDAHMTMSNVYLATHLEKSFGGMRDAFDDAVLKGDIPEPDEESVKATKNVTKYAQWLSDYMQKKIKADNSMMKDIILAVYNSDTSLSREQILNAIMVDIIQLYIKNVFTKSENVSQAVKIMHKDKVMLETIALKLPFLGVNDTIDALIKETLPNVV